jgi:hypothetical protein
MTLLLLLAVVLQNPEAAGRTYWPVPIERMAETKRTHARTCGLVVYSRRMADGDQHVTIARGDVKVVLEVIPGLALPQLPKKNQTIVAWGIVRYDQIHKWIELHPLEGFAVVSQCPKELR